MMRPDYGNNTTQKEHQEIPQFNTLLIFIANGINLEKMLKN